MGQIWIILCYGISFCLEFSTKSNSHAEREKLPRLVALRNLFRTFYIYLRIFYRVHHSLADKSFLKISFSILTSWLVFTYIRDTCFTSLTPRTQQWCPRGDEMKLQDCEIIRLFRPKILLLSP